MSRRMSNDSEGSIVGSYVAGVVDRQMATELLETIGRALLLGGIAGMGTFTYVHNDFALPYVHRWLPIGLVVLAGVFNQLSTRDLRSGLAVSFVAIALGFAIHSAAWILPLFVSGYAPGAVNLLLPFDLGRAVMTGILVLPLTYYGGYFGGLLLSVYS
jgi:hypothetical protein